MIQLTFFFQLEHFSDKGNTQLRDEVGNTRESVFIYFLNIYKKLLLETFKRLKPLVEKDGASQLNEFFNHKQKKKKQENEN